MRISDWSSDVCSSDLVAASVTAWHPAVISGRRVGFAGELLATIRQIAGEIGGATTASAETAATLLAGDRIDARAKSVAAVRSEEHTSELQSLMRISYAGFCLKKNKNNCMCITIDRTSLSTKRRRDRRMTVTKKDNIS